MATRTIWQDVYAGFIDVGSTTLAQNLARTYTGSAATLAFRTAESSNDNNADVGIQGIPDGGVQKYGLPLTDHPNFKAPSGSLDTEQARGISARHSGEFDTVQTGDPVEFNLPMLGNAYNVSMFSRLLFQNGCSVSGSGQQLQTATTYDSADPEVFGSFVRFLQPAGGTDAIDNVVQGAICSSLTMSGEAGNVLTIEPTIRAAKWSQVDCGTGNLVNTAAVFDDANNLKFEDCTVAIKHDGSSWVEVFSPSISVTV
ncbi:MAG: hypothetical protein VYD72_03215, partial [Chloroflexota bacterium]|nr:hypothetical protein [Chloroflexota bacterium]